MSSAVLMLPMPISANNLFRNFTRNGKQLRVPDDRYVAWRKEAAFHLGQQELHVFKAPVEVIYRIGRPDRRRRDLGNLEKCLSDALVDYGVLADDSLIHDLRLVWDDSVTGCQVEIRPLDGAA